jgi:hypothetical protein
MSSFRVTAAVALAVLLCHPADAQEVRPSERMASDAPAREVIASSQAVLAAAQEPPGDLPAGKGEARRPRSWILLPHLFYTPETRLSGGAVVGNYAGGGVGARPTAVLFSFALTAQRQIIAEVMSELYFDGATLWVNGKLRAMKYPDVFYGIGNGTTRETEGVSPRGASGSRCSRSGRWRGEDGWECGHSSTPRTSSTSRPVAGSPPVECPEPRAVWRPERAWWRRETPATGRSRRAAACYAEAGWTGFAPTLGSDFRFGLAGMDARSNTPLGAGVLALHVHAEAAHGAAPFTLLPKLGGSRLLRGCREGRFRDDRLGVVEAEYGFPVVGRFGGVVFGGAGDVAPAFDDLPALARLERAVAAGMRFRVSQVGVNIRLDWARGRKNGGLTIGLGEAF